MKRCTGKSCGQLKPLSAFGKDKHQIDGMNRRCKQCVLQSCHRSRGRTESERKEKKERADAKREAALSRAKAGWIRLQSGKYAAKYKVEADGIALVISALPETCGLKQFGDGARSDYAINFDLSLGKDGRWLPQQLKTCSSPQPPFTFSDVKPLYDCDVVCIAPYATPPRIFVYSPHLIAVHEDQLSGSDIRLGVNDSVWWQYETTIAEYFSEAFDRWKDEANTRPLRALSLQCNRGHQLEFCMSELSELLDPERTFSLPKQRNSSVDRMMDGQRVQDKCAHRSSAGCKGFTARLCHPSLQTTYFAGENDWYCFHHVAKNHGLYLQWMIPEHEMLSNGVINEFDSDGNVSRAGSGYVICHIADASSDPRSRLAELQNAVAGGFPKKNCSSWTAKYCRTMRIPDWFEWPPGLLDSMS